MTALLLFKQKLKNFYSDIEVILLPIFKFGLAFAYFYGIDYTLGYLTFLNSSFILLILSLICAVLPWNVIVLIGCGMIIGHCYAISIEVAAFVVVLMLFMFLMFLRFSRKDNIVLAFSQLLFGVNVPALVPIGTGLMRSADSCLPAGCGVIIYYFMKYIVSQASVLHAPLEGEEIFGRIKMLADGLIQNPEMWLAVIAVIATTLLVAMIRSSAFDYAWRVAIVVGGVIYIVIMFGGSLVLNLEMDITKLIVSTVIAVVIGLVLEFFVFGGDYTRIEKLNYEDDEYYYYVKAVPKSSVTTSSRSIKRINGNTSEDAKRTHEEKYHVNGSAEFSSDDSIDIPSQPDLEVTPEDFEKKLEESLRDL